MELKLIFILVSLGAMCYHNAESAKASCEFSSMKDVEETINGKVEFSQGSASENITIKVSELVGLAAGKHGFHIHSKGNCQDPGPHYNPLSKDHGYIFDTDRDYHSGDFGNLDIEDDVPFSKTYSVNGSIVGIFDESQNKILGKAFVIHGGEDDLGKGGTEHSKMTGSAGRKLACCVITDSASSSASAGLTNILLTLTIPLAMVMTLLQ